MTRFAKNGNDILTFLHCKKCLKDNTFGTAPRHWARLEFGWTEKGFQLWCVRHDVNIISVDLKGQKVKVLE